MHLPETNNIFILGRIPLFSGLEASLLSEILRHSSCRQAAKGERIYWQGDTPSAFYHVLSGRIRCALGSAVGEEKVFDVISPGQSFGLAEIFGTTPYSSFAEAVEPTILLQVSKAGLHEAIAISPALTMRVLEAIADRQASFQRDAAACYFQSANKRLVDYLLREAGPDLDPFGDTALDLPMSKSLIAARLGITAETLSRALRELSNEGLIKVRGSTIVLREALVAQHGAEVRERKVATTPRPWNHAQASGVPASRRTAQTVPSVAWL